MSPFALNSQELEGIAMIVVPLGLFVVLPVVAILTRHQRHMTEILNKSQGADYSHLVLQKLDQMQIEINALKERQIEVILSLEDKRATPPSLSERVRE